MSSLVWAILVTTSVVAATSGCWGAPPDGTSSREAPGQTFTPPPTDVTSVALPAGTTQPPAASSQCEVTLPNGSVPPGENPSPYLYGNGVLWSEFWPRNTVLAGPKYIMPDGSIRMKWPWWREVIGDLHIAGRRLDGPAPPIATNVSSAGYPPRGFLASTIYFPTEGCWELTATIADAQLKFVTVVLKVST